MSMKDNFRYYSVQVITRLDDQMHVLSEKSKYNIRHEAINIAKDFKDLDYKFYSVTKIKSSDFLKIVDYWKEKGLSSGTIQNKATVLRHILIVSGNKDAVIYNKDLKIPIRDVLNIANIDKSSHLSEKVIGQIKDLSVKSAIRLEIAYGLRKVESMNVVHALSLKYIISKNGVLTLKGSWCKNGRSREFLMSDQGKVLNAVKNEIVSNKLSLKGMKIQQFRNKIDATMKNIQKGDKQVHPHGFRHAYAQSRYKTLTGLNAPASGGKIYNDMTSQEKQNYNKACHIISQELGHNRQGIVQTYIGR